MRLGARGISVFMMALALTLTSAGCKKKSQEPARTPAEGRKARRPKKPFDKNSWGGYACRVFRKCYARYKAFGQVSGRIVIPLDATGRAVGASYSRGKAPAPVKRCIVENAKKVQVPRYTGGAGRIYCEYSGQLMSGGMEMLSESWGYRPGGAMAARVSGPPKWYPSDFPFPRGARLVKEVPPRKGSPHYSGLFISRESRKAIEAQVLKGAKASGWKLRSTKPRPKGGKRFEFVKTKPKRRRLLFQTRVERGRTRIIIATPKVDL